MKITEITVNAGRTLQHPCESYANIRPSVTLKASLADGDDPLEATRQLQRQAEQMVEEHSMVLKASLLERDVASREEHELAKLTQSIASNQQRLEELQANAEMRATSHGQLLFDN